MISTVASLTAATSNRLTIFLFVSFPIFPLAFATATTRSTAQTAMKIAIRLATIEAHLQFSKANLALAPLVLTAVADRTISANVITTGTITKIICFDSAVAALSH